MVVLAFWTGGQFFIEKQYTLLVFAGIWALMSGLHRHRPRLPDPQAQRHLDAARQRPAQPRRCPRVSSAEEVLGRQHFDADEAALLVEVEDDVAGRVAERLDLPSVIAVRGTNPASSGIRLM